MISWDLTLLHLINRDWAHPVLDWLMPAVSAVEAWYPLMALAVLLVLWRGRARGVLLCLCVGMSLGIADGIISNTLKEAIGRVRPRSAITGVTVRDLGDAKPAFMRLFVPPTQRPSQPRGLKHGNSFPSSHTMNMFALATVIALFHRRWGIAIYVLAALVAYSRVYCGAHWPSDIAPSMAMGVLVGWAVTRLMLHASRRLGFGHVCHGSEIATRS
jgi:undecaprenyl-diphosphatase